MDFIDLTGEDPSRFGIELSIEGVYAKRKGIEGAEHMTNEYYYIDVLEPFSVLINGQKVSLPKDLISTIEENIISYYSDQL